MTSTALRWNFKFTRAHNFLESADIAADSYVSSKFAGQLLSNGLNYVLLSRVYKPRLKLLLRLLRVAGHDVLRPGRPE